ncbi:hypothetical protein ACFWJM_21630 [Streptomyces sp. NPDC127077]|uniref:hypothetical protein n=1 Tax=Streptomyces sp. NPDC127077 TaxID=3347131 RepID=UPI00365C3BAF
MAAMTRVRRVSTVVRVRLIATVCAGLLCASLAGCGTHGSPTAEASTASAGTLASAAPSSAAASTPDPTPSVGELATPTETPTTEEATTAASQEPVQAGGSEASALWGKAYSGTASVSVDIYDYCSTDGSRHLAGSQTYSMNSTLNLGRPEAGGDQTESNPFSMLFAAGYASQAGAVSFRSSSVSTVSSQDLAGNYRDPNLLLTYWDIDWSGGELDARLTDPHAREAVVPNLLNWPGLLVACRSDLGQMPGGFPHALAAGTTFTGRLDGSGASLTAEGSTVDGVVAFKFTFDGTAS